MSKPKKAQNRSRKPNNFAKPEPKPALGKRSFHFEFKTTAQKVAWSTIEQHDLTFLLGSPGTGKTFLACAYAVQEVLAKRKSRIVLTRPILEAAGESIGFLPGDVNEKTMPYMIPMYDCLDIVLGKDTVQREFINKAIEIAPIAFMRGRTFSDAICIFDEAQNATFAQIKLFLTRFGDNSKVIITGDPNQCDLNCKIPPLVDIMKKLEDVSGIGTIEFQNSSIIRHPLVQAILEKLEK